MSVLDDTLSRIVPPDTLWSVRAAAHQQHLTKPPQSLGRLEEIANRIVGIQQTLKPEVDPARVVVFAGDHGIASEGVSPYPREVTAQMVRNFLSGGAAVNALARACNVEVQVVDAGVAGELDEAGGLIRKRLRAGTRNFLREPAMTEDEAALAIEIGIELAQAASRAGVRMAACGEMGIGNTTSASVIAAALTGLPAAEVTGRGAGAGDEMLAHKVRIVDRALELYRPRFDRPLGILASAGGYEIAAMTGFYLGAAAERMVTVVDGFIATAAAALAVRLRPDCARYLFTGHLSVEPGHAALLDVLNQRPILDLSMRLGEGSGAVLAMAVIRGAVHAFRDMATFQSAGVSNA